jgi:START domain
MATQKKFFLPLLCLMVVGKGFAEPIWDLKTDREGIKVFTSSSSSSNIKSVRVECSIVASPPQLLEFLLDLDKQHEWVYNSKRSVLLKKATEQDLIFYSEVTVPWPFSNRDYIAHLNVSHPSSQVTLIESHSEPNFLPYNKGIVRITTSSSQWTITNQGNGQLSIEYTVHFDPGGFVPAWLTNLFLTKGPYESFKKLKEHFGTRNS